MKNSFHLLLFFVTSFFIFSCEENQYDSNGFKHGNWTEYINADGSTEVTKDSAAFIRKIEYDHGDPVGISKDYYVNGSLQCEYYLISNKYKKDSRPKDKYTGLIVWFTQDTTTIKEWSYYDEYGNWDFKKYFLTGVEEIEKDERFDREYLQMNFQNWNQLNMLFAKYHNTPDLFDADFDEIRASLFADKELKELLTSDNSELNKIFLQYLVMQRFFASVEDEVYEYDDTHDDQQEAPTAYDQEEENNDIQLQNQRRKCYECDGTGKCKTCMKTFQVHYWAGVGPGWKNQNETRPGQVMCDDCDGAGVIYGRHQLGEDPEYKKCYVSSCRNGWKTCPSCNYNGNGNNLGQCSRCDGSGYSN